VRYFGNANRVSLALHVQLGFVEVGRDLSIPE
jgi:predicted GNAT superfamily acetyltransferase